MKNLKFKKLIILTMLAALTSTVSVCAMEDINVNGNEIRDENGNVISTSQSKNEVINNKIVDKEIDNKLYDFKSQIDSLKFLIENKENNEIYSIEGLEELKNDIEEFIKKYPEGKIKEKYIGQFKNLTNEITDFVKTYNSEQKANNKNEDNYEYEYEYGNDENEDNYEYEYGNDENEIVDEEKNDEIIINQNENKINKNSENLIEPIKNLETKELKD